MPRAKKETTEEIIAKVLAAQPATEKRPFFSAKSPGMWTTIGGLAVYAFTLFGNITGCFQTKFTKDQKIEAAYELSQALSQGDTAITKQMTKNYWYFYSLHARDSIQVAQMANNIMDSLHNHRIDLEDLNRRSKIPKIIFRGQ